MRNKNNIQKTLKTLDRTGMMGSGRLHRFQPHISKGELSKLTPIDERVRGSPENSHSQVQQHDVSDEMETMQREAKEGEESVREKQSTS